MLTALLLIAAGMLGGAINSLAGGGSFIVFPALLAAGVPPVMANTSNTFAALPGYVSGMIGFWDDIKQHRDKLIPYSLAALVGGYAGAELLLHVSDNGFEAAVPWLMALAVILFAFGGRISGWLTAGDANEQRGRLRLVPLILLVVVCFYGGFFNAGLGILLLAAFAVGGMSNLHAMNGLKLLVSTLVAAIAIVRFAAADSIAWYEGGLAFVGTLIGGYLAARLAHLIPMRILRIGIIAYGIVLTAFFFWQVYGAG